MTVLNALSARPATILVADDDVAMCALLEELCAATGSVVTAPSGDALRCYLEEARRGCVPCPDVLVSDVRMPTFGGLQALRFIAREKLPIQVILVTAFGDEVTHKRARALGAQCVIDKPFDGERLLVAVRGALSAPR